LAKTISRRISSNVYEFRLRILTILELISINPHISIRQAKRWNFKQIGIPRVITHRLLQSVRYPYHITLVQELSADDHRMRAQFCTLALDVVEQDPELFWNVLFKDEATFHSDGCLNRHNCHHWSPVNPHWYRQILYPSIIGPFMFGWEYAMVRSSNFTFLNMLVLIYSSFRIICQNILRTFY